MRKISKEERKEHNKWVDYHNEQKAERTGAYETLIPLFVACAIIFGLYLPEPFGGYAFVFFVVLFLIMLLGKMINSREEKNDYYR